MNKMRIKSPVTVLCLLLLSACNSPSEESVNNQSTGLCELVENSCTFVLLDEATSTYTIINSNRAYTRFTPASTFKIANSVIALETGTLSGTDVSLRVDLDAYPQQDWWQPAWATDSYNLRGAFQNSVFPIYRSIAADIGEQNMQTYLNNFAYGNQDISSGLDNFWVAGSLAISAVEQVDFLRELNRNGYGLSDNSMNGLREIMLVEESGFHQLYAKTGAALLEDGNVVFWYVGFIEKENGVHYFAFNMHRPPSPENAKLRIELSREYLRRFGVI